MPITQERLMTLISITERAIQVTKVHKQAAKNLLIKIHDDLSNDIRRSQNSEQTISIVQELLTPFLNIIIDHEMSPEDFMNFREEQVHFKYTSKRNTIQRDYYKRARGRKKMREAADFEEMTLAEDYAMINAAFPPKAEGEINLDKLEEPKETISPEIDPDRAEYERQRDQRLRNMQTAKFTLPESDNTPQDRKEGKSTPHKGE